MLKTKLWVSALVRRCDLEMRQIVVVKKGDADAGSVLLRLDRKHGKYLVLSQSRDAAGNRCWLVVAGSGPVDHQDADVYIQKRTATDPDIWVVDIDDYDEGFIPDEPIVS